MFKIIDITKRKEYEKYLYKCIFLMPYQKYKKENAEGLATIGFENFPSPWLKKE